MIMKSRRPMAILSAAIGVYFLVAPPPAQISHSVMEESDGSRDVGLLQNDEHHVLQQAGEGEYPSTHDELHSSALQELQANEDIAEGSVENDVESESRPTSEPTPAAESSINEEDETSAEETTNNDAKEPMPNSTPQQKIPTSNGATSNNSTRARIRDQQSDKANEKKRPEQVGEDEKTDKMAGPLFHMVFTTGSTTLSTLNVRSIESFQSKGSAAHSSAQAFGWCQQQKQHQHQQRR